MHTPGSYGFRHAEPLPFLLLDSIGWQSADNAQYRNDGLRRTDAGHAIFQYTLRGQGRFELDGQMSELTPGRAFFVTVPSAHRYYYGGDGGEPWEFVYINAKGEDAARMWARIISLHGPVAQLARDSLALVRFWELYRAVSVERVSDPAALSALLYNWVLSLLAPAAAGPADAADGGSDGALAVTERAKRYIRDNCALPLTLQDIADHCGVSRPYLCRLFQRREAVSPLEYVRRRRVEAAVTLLRRTDLPVREIAAQCGFDSPSYFGKVFRAYLSVSPGEYRSRGADFPYDVVFLE